MDTLDTSPLEPMPCPHCGYVFDAELDYDDLQMSEDYCWVGCQNKGCYAGGPVVWMERDDTEAYLAAKAVAAWNRRTAAAQLGQAERRVAPEPLWNDERIRASAYNMATTMPNGLKMVSLNAMRGQMERMRDTYEAERDTAAIKLVWYDRRVAALEAQLTEAIAALKLAYLKHHLEDESIGWDELSETLLDTLSNVMGVEELVKWQEGGK